MEEWDIMNLMGVVKEKNNKGVQMSTITEGHLTADIG